MKKLFMLLLVMSTITFSKDYKLFYLGGQSNMQGFGKVSELPADLSDACKTVRFFQGNWANDDEPVAGEGKWDVVVPGFGYGSKYENGEYILSEKFGPELTFAIRITELMPEENIAILKYAKGGSSLANHGSRWGTWAPDYNDSTGINQYDHFLSAVRNALAVKDIDGDGEEDRLIPAGIIWMQGESDADNSVENARAYKQNLKRMMDLIRAAFRVDDLPIVIGQIADSGNDKTDGRMMDNMEHVWEAQLHFVNNDPAAAIVIETRKYKFVDNWHFDTEGQLDLGKRFAEKIFTLMKK